MQSLVAETGLTITNPLVLYRALVATKKVEPDPAQHRLALHLQKLYHRLKDYEPEIEYRAQLEAVTRTLGRPSGASAADGAASHDRPFSRIFDGLRSQRAEAESLALTRRLTSQEAAINLDSPQGLLLYGEVGTGKSMLIDLLADALPNGKKKRYHFNEFMLETFARIEQQRISRATFLNTVHQPEHSLIAMARDMIQTSPILFLDEFQLPDRASSKIISNLFTSFFQLGGVLVATSNRMPEELSKASGIEYTAPSSPTSQLGFAGLRSFWRGSTDDLRRGVSSRQNDFTQFVEVLKARCETWNMESKVDFRRRDSGTKKRRSEAGARVVGSTRDGAGQGAPLEDREDREDRQDRQDRQDDATEADGSDMPAYYFQLSSDLPSAQSPGEESLWQASMLRAVNSGQASVSEVPWQAEVLSVYGRKVPVPKACNGTSMWTFEQLCNTYLGPADYITLTSTFHTLILTDVPVLTSVRRNEARRFITLLDALYESRCRLLISAEMGPDEIFFPEQGQARQGQSAPSGSQQEQEGDGVYAETLSEIYQDATSPFRPNVSTYGTNGNNEMPLRQSAEPHGNSRSILADEDADFGPVYGAGRSAGASTYTESANNGGSMFGGKTGPDFQKTQAFTGQDERFAYKRAESRLWELCSQRWWERAEAGNWWRPVSRETRAWEGVEGVEAQQQQQQQQQAAAGLASEPPLAAEAGGEDGGKAVLFRHAASPFRVVSEPPPKLAWTHMWGMMRWGSKAGVWGKGTDGVEERLQQKQREKEKLDRIEVKRRSEESKIQQSGCGRVQWQGR